jgi:hypothetical protein
LAERRRHKVRPECGGPSRDDIWQAATLLIGVYGRDAMEYADDRRSEQHEHGDLAAARTWHLIISQIEHLLQGAPVAYLH